MSADGGSSRADGEPGSSDAGLVGYRSRTRARERDGVRPQRKIPNPPGHREIRALAAYGARSTNGYFTNIDATYWIE